MNVRLIIPDTIHNGNTDDYLREIADIAGGFTATQGIGGWKDDKGNLVVEPVTIVDIAVGFQEHGLSVRVQLIQLRNLAKTIARDLYQTCVFLSIDGKAEYVKP